MAVGKVFGVGEGQRKKGRTGGLPAVKSVTLFFLERIREEKKWGGWYLLFGKRGR